MLISCIMANFNTKKEFLDASILSILEQDYKDFEFIIVDDCSTNESLKYIEDYQKKDNRIILLKNETNLGLAASLNKAINISKGKYILRMDSDDISLPYRFKSQVKFMEEHPNISVAGTFARKIGASNNLMASPYYSSEYCKAQLLFAPCLIHPSVIMRRDFLIENELFYNEKYKCSQDFDLWTRCIEKGNVCMQNEVLLFYRVHDNQVSIAKRDKQIEYAKEIGLRQIYKLGISPNDDEINTHLILCRMEKYDNDSLSKIIKWRDKLLKANSVLETYDKRALKITINDRASNIVLSSNENLYKKIIDILKINGVYIYNYIYSIILRAYFRRVSNV